MNKQNENNESVRRQLLALGQMTQEEMIEKWKDLFGVQPPQYGRVFMRKRLAHRIQEALTDSVLLVGRHENGKRTAKEIGIHSLRLGNEVGTHEIIIATGAETITLKHEAENRSLFANGALAAAKFLEGKPAGLCSMQNII